MKKQFINFISVFFCLLFLLHSVSLAVYAANDGEFVLLNISGYNDDGEKSVQEDNVFYIKNNTLYAPIELFEAYTMYDYDKTNQAFVRVGQEYKTSNSKVILDYENSTASVFYLTAQKEIYNIKYYAFGDTYFFPLAEMASYLKASIAYVDSDTISIVNSGISISDALYNYEPLTSCLDYFDIRDDIFAGDDSLAKTACILGYFGETIYAHKISNLFGEYGDYKKYLEILKGAVTNNESYEQVFNNENLLADVLGVTDAVYNKVYKKATKVYNLTANSIATMFEEYKAVNALADESPFNNFFPEEQAAVDQINSFGKYISTVDQFIDTVKYYYDFYKVNQDNKDAIELLGNLNELDSRAYALRETAKLYGNSVVESTATMLSKELAQNLAEETLKDVAGDLVPGVNKVKLAISIVDTVFKVAGFDISDNSGYNVMLADELKSYVLKNLDGDKDNLSTQENFNNMRLTLILGMLIDIESYKMGNKLADKHECGGCYDTDIEEATQRLALFYLAKGGEKYDTVEGMQEIAEQNRKQIAKLDVGHLKVISADVALDYLSLIYSDSELQKRQWNANNFAGFDYEENDFFYYDWAGKDQINILRENVTGEKKTIVTASEPLCSTIQGRVYYVRGNTVCSCDFSGADEKTVFTLSGADASAEISALIPLSTSRILVVAKDNSGSGNLVEFGIIRLDTGKYIQIKTDGHRVENFYTQGKYLYYQQYDYNATQHISYNNRVVRYDLITNQAETLAADFEGRKIVALFDNCLYSTSQSNVGYDEQYTIFKMDLSTLKETKLASFITEEPVHDLLIDEDRVFVSTGTGGGNGFGVLKGEKLDYHNQDVLNYDGLLGEEMGFYKTYIICSCWDGWSGTKYGYQQIYKIE